MKKVRFVKQYKDSGLLDLAMYEIGQEVEVDELTADALVEIGVAEHVEE